MKITLFSRLLTVIALSVSFTAVSTGSSWGTSNILSDREETGHQNNIYYIDFPDLAIATATEVGVSPLGNFQAPIQIGKLVVSNTSNNYAIADPNSSYNSLGETLQRTDNRQAVTAIEQTWERDYENYFKANLSNTSMGSAQIGQTLAKLSSQTGKKAAIIYAIPTPTRLELVLILPQQDPIRKSVPEANQQALLSAVKNLTLEITDLTKINTTTYLPPAQQLYSWMIAPLEKDLKNNQIDTLIFCLGSGLRSLPLAALHDGKQFLVEKFSIGLIPAFNMIDINYRDIKNSPVLAMGASQFKELPPLAAVPLELSTIVQDSAGEIVPGYAQIKPFLNQEFTLDNLRKQRTAEGFRIVHLATHAEFKSGSPQNSYIQFWDNKLTLDRMRQLQWNNPPVELLVLSACRTAVGDKDAEMGFAGLAVNSGVKSALASLWSVSDLGTLALMTEFYQQLRIAPIKAEALRQAQIGMLRGEVHLENGKLRGPMLGDGVTLPPNLAALEINNFQHPFYWAAFTMIGSPW